MYLHTRKSKDGQFPTCVSEISSIGEKAVTSLRIRNVSQSVTFVSLSTFLHSDALDNNIFRVDFFQKIPETSERTSNVSKFLQSTQLHFAARENPRTWTCFSTVFTVCTRIENSTATKESRDPVNSDVVAASSGDSRSPGARMKQNAGHTSLRWLHIVTRQQTPWKRSGISPSGCRLTVRLEQGIFVAMVVDTKVRRYEQPEDELGWLNGGRGRGGGGERSAKKGKSYKRGTGHDDGHQTPQHEGTCSFVSLLPFVFRVLAINFYFFNNVLSLSLSLSL